MGARRGFKVTDADRKTRVGIAVETYADLKRKTVEKFKLDLQESQIVFQTRDGMQITCEEEFAKLTPQSLLIWVKKGEKAETDAEILYRTIREVNIDFLTTGEKVQEFFTEQMKSKVYKLAEVLKSLEDEKSKFNTREEDPEWFKVKHSHKNEAQGMQNRIPSAQPTPSLLTHAKRNKTGIDSRSKTKEEYMFRRSQDRIRTYYYKTKDELMKNSNLSQEELHNLLQELQILLKEAKFFGCYFDRSKKQNNLCDQLGIFKCQGRWDKEACLHMENHTINPYRSREDRIIFQTWNLDHRIERSRMIIPCIHHALKILQSDKKARLDIQQIFNDLFTLNNLKLVHIVCHDKGTHKKINPDRYIKDS